MVKDPTPHQDPAFLRGILNDTGKLARDLLGYNYDEIAGGHRVNVGTGGIVPFGKTQEIVELMDDDSLQFKLVMAPRDARKSTLAQCFAIRRILKNPNIRIFYAGRTDDIVRNKSIAVRKQMLRPEIEAIWGPQQGDKWDEVEWTVAGRSNHGLQNATFTAFSQDSIPTGGRCDVLLLDDFIDHTNVTTAEQNRKSKEKWGLLQPFIASGCEVIVLCTLWADDDLNSSLRSNKLFAPPTGGQIVCGAGVRVVRDGGGGLDLEVLDGGLTFPHMTLDYLRKKLHAMALDGDYRSFVRQYLNESPDIDGIGFRRQDFQAIKWGSDMEQLSGYLLTDTAIGKKDSACYNVLAYVGIDPNEHFYLLDLKVGRWEPSEFKDEFFDMLERWQPKVNHCGEVWEQVALATAYRDSIEHDSRARKTKLHTLEIPRPSTSHKADRIKRLQPVMRGRRFFVVKDTMPKSFQDNGNEKVLFDEVGFYDATRTVFAPGGELVEQFVKESAKKDIPDALAMVLEWNKKTQRRYCNYKAWKPKTKGRSLTDQRDSAYHADRYGAALSGDWWERTLRESGI